MTATGTPVYDVLGTLKFMLNLINCVKLVFLESITGETISRLLQKSSSLCDECFAMVEKYDKLRKQTINIQKKMMR